MNNRRCKQIIKFALNYLNDNCDRLEQTFSPDYTEQDTYITEQEPDICIGNFEMKQPSAFDFNQLADGKAPGNWRTKQVLLMALSLIAEQDDLQSDYPYYGNVDRYGDTHVTVEDENFTTPTKTEIEALIDNLNEIYPKYPAIKIRQQTWKIYDYVEDDEPPALGRDKELIETVFYCGSMSRSDVKRSLIGHDGFNESIELIRG